MRIVPSSRAFCIGLMLSMAAVAQDEPQLPMKLRTHKINAGRYDRPQQLGGFLGMLQQELPGAVCHEFSQADENLLGKDVNPPGEFRNFGDVVDALKKKGFKVAEAKTVTILRSPRAPMGRSAPLEVPCPAVSVQGKWHDLVMAIGVPLSKANLGVQYGQGTDRMEYRLELKQPGTLRDALVALAEQNPITWSVYYAEPKREGAMGNGHINLIRKLEE